MYVYEDSPNVSELIIDILSFDNSSEIPKIESHGIYSYPEPQKCFVIWGLPAEYSREGYTKLAEGLLVSNDYEFPVPTGGGPDVLPHGNKFKLHRHYDRVRMDGDLIYHVVLPPNFYVEREETRNYCNQTMKVITRKYIGRQTISSLLLEGEGSLIQEIIFVGPDEPGFNIQDSYPVYRPAF